MSKLMLIVAAVFVAGCSPVSVHFTMFADNSKLVESTVHRDKGGNDKVAIIDVRGLISEQFESGVFGDAGTSVNELSLRLKKAEEDSRVRAIIIRINSPGGTVTGSDMMYREVRRFAEETKKPVVCSMGEVAASGGYYLALAGDRIIAEPTTLTGSIGVIMPTINFSEGLNRIGIHSRSIKSAKNKDLVNPLEPAREEHYEVLQATVDEFYAGFKAVVVERRSKVSGEGTRALDAGKIEELTDGRVVTGVRAAEVGLIDQTGGVREAFEVAKKLAGIEKGILVKYFPEGGIRPRSPYAEGDVERPRAGMEINLVQIRGMMAGAAGAGVYYLWLPPG